MKKLNKKGFTLVELLAVIVILALLIVVVATTALPAMNNAKKSALKTYAQRVIEQAKTYYTTECVLKTGGSCDYSTWTLKTVMGADADETKYQLSITDIDYEDGVVKIDGTVTDVNNHFKSSVTDSIVAEPIRSSETEEETEEGEA